MNPNYTPKPPSPEIYVEGVRYVPTLESSPTVQDLMLAIGRLYHLDNLMWDRLTLDAKLKRIAELRIYIVETSDRMDDSTFPVDDLAAVMLDETTKRLEREKTYVPN